MKRIGIIAFHNLHLMQFLYKYTDILDEQGIDYDVLYWNRDGVEYEKKFKGRAIRFDYPTSNYCSGIKKICGFLRADMSLVFSFVCLSICILMIVFSCSSCKSSEHIVVDDSHSVSIPC